MKIIKPTPPLTSGALPGLGHALEFQQNSEALWRRGFEEHGAVFALKLANQNVAVVVGPENQRKFFLETDKRLGIQEPYRFLKAMFGEILFIAEHDIYLEHRSVIMEVFRREKMLQYLTVMQEQVSKWFDSLGEEGEMELTGEIVRLVQEVAGNCFLGPKAHREIGQEFWMLYEDLSKSLDPLLPPDLPLPKFRRRDRSRARMKEILAPVIAERRLHPDEYDDFLQDLVNKRFKGGGEVEEELIVNLLIGLMFAGHETTAGQAAWSVIQLIQNPDYLELVLEEIENIAPPGTEIDAKRLSQLHHVHWAVMETERMRPSAELLMRTVEEDIEFGNYLIPKGWLVQVTQTLGHHLPALFERPERYDPLRFSPERQEDKQDRFALFGFGGGIHKCTGINFAYNEMSIIVAMLFGQYDLELVTKNPHIKRGLGASRPSDTFVRYKRKQGLGENLEPFSMVAN